MSAISKDDLRKMVEWARNAGKVSHDAGGGVRFEHDGKTYVVPAELLAPHAEREHTEVDLGRYAVSG